MAAAPQQEKLHNVGSEGITAAIDFEGLLRGARCFSHLSLHLVGVGSRW